MIDACVKIIPANALIKNAKLSRAGEAYNWAATSGTAGLAISLLRRSWGGLWVGGNVTISTDQLSFAPNGLNSALTDGDLCFSIPFKSIDKVEWRWGMITGIVEITWQNDALATAAFRCANSKRIAGLLREAATATR